MIRNRIATIILLILLAALPAIAATPPADSLMNRLKHEKTDTGKVMLYNKLAREIGNTTLQTSVSDRVTRYNHALQYADSGLRLAQEINFRKGEAELYRTVGAMYYFLNEFDLAISNYDKAFAIASEIKDEYGQAALMYNIAMIYQHQDKLTQALKHYFVAAALMEKLERKSALLIINANIAQIFRLLEEHEIAVEFINKSLPVAYGLKDTLRIAMLYDELAHSHIALHDTVSSIIDFEKSIELYQAKKNAASEARVLHNYADKIESLPLEKKRNILDRARGLYEKLDPEHQNLAYIYFHLSQLCGRDSVRYFQDKALKQALLSEHVPTISQMYYNLGSEASKNKEWDKAGQYYQAALKYNQQVGSANLDRSIYNDLSGIYQQKGDHQQAFGFKQRAIRVQDSIAAIESKTRLELLQMEYEVKEQQDRQDAEWKAQAEQQRQLIERRRRGIFIILAAIGFLVILLGIIIRSRRRTWNNNVRLQEQHEEILQIQEELRQSNDELNMYKEYLEEMVSRQVMEQADKDQQLHHINDNLPGFIYRKVTRADGTEYTSFISNSAEQLIGLPIDEAVRGKGSLLPLISDREALNELREKEKESIRTMTPFIFEHHFLRGDQPVWLYHHALPHPGKNGDIIWDGFVIDITGQKEVEVSLEKAKEQAEESDRLKSAFLSSMSHEVRTPMNAILGFIGFIEREDIPPAKRSGYIRIVHESIDQLMHLVKNIIDISKLDVQQVVVYPTHFALNPLMEEIRQHWEKYISERKPLNIILDDSRSVHPLVLFNDLERLRQVLANLIENAIKYTDKGFIRFGYEPAGDPSELLFFVEDTGIGIPKNQQGVIFEYFRQGDTGSKIDRGGTGLGLSISKGLVEGMGGRIWVESVEGQGSIFFFTIRKELQNMPDNRNT